MFASSSTASAPQATPSTFVKDVGIETFMADVVDASRQRPVLVDFWAPWCGPCKQLGPALEKLVNALGGTVLLAKVNIDENPEIAQQLRVQSIPAVFVFYQGQPVDGFMGAIPESQLKTWLDKLLKTLRIAPAPQDDKAQIDEALTEADTALANGDLDLAARAYDLVLTHEPENARAYAGAVNVLTRRASYDDAQAMIDGAPEAITKAPELAAAQTALALAQESQKALEGRAAAEQKLAENPDDHAARFDLALALYGNGEHEAAIDALIEICRRQRSWNDEAARKQLLKFFEALGPTNPLTIGGRRRLSSVLFS